MKWRLRFPSPNFLYLSKLIVLGEDENIVHFTATVAMAFNFNFQLSDHILFSVCPSFLLPALDLSKAFIFLSSSRVCVLCNGANFLIQTCIKNMHSFFYIFITKYPSFLDLP